MKAEEILKIYMRLVVQDTILAGEYLENCARSEEMSSVDCLAHAVLNDTRDTIEIAREILESEQFCAACLYANLDTSRKAITRYCILEKEESTAKQLLYPVRELFNEICMKMNQYKTGEGCNRIKNPAFAMIQEILPDDDDFDDDDEQN